MRGFFSRIFLSFWGTIIGIVVILTLLVSLVSREHFLIGAGDRVGGRIRSMAERSVVLYETLGGIGVKFYADFLRDRFRIRLGLVDEEGKVLYGVVREEDVRSLLRKMGQRRDIAFERFRKNPVFGARVRGITGKLYLAIFTLPGGILGEIFEIGGAHVAVLLFMLLISSLVCFALARSISRPISHLKEAVDRFSSGDLKARADARVGAKYEEVQELMEKFNGMASRIEHLLETHRTFLRDISHELKSPLTRLQVAIELARQSGDSEREGYLSRVEREAERLSTLISRLVLLSRIEFSGELSDTSPVDLKEILEEVVADSRFEGETEGKKVEAICEESLLVVGDREILRSALENLVRNALVHTPPGTSVSVRGWKEGGKVFVSVADDGPGVPQEDLEKIFLPFYRGKGKGGEGAGLGLAIVQRAAEMHGGGVRAENGDDGGFVVTAEFPALAS